MFKIFKSLGKYDSKQDFYGWSYKIILNTSIDHLRKQIKEDNNLEIEKKQHIGAELNEGMNKLEADDIFKHIQSLNENERLIFCMFEIEGYSHKEISESLKISVSFSKWVLYNAKKRLREKLKYVR